MQTAGNATTFFSDVIPDKFVPEILDLVVAAWERMPKLDQRQFEPRITALLKLACVEEYDEKYRTQGPPFFVVPENQIADPVTGKEVARTDLDIHIRSLHIPKQRPYFTFEAKRLNIPGGKRVRSNATEYVGDSGMMCFITVRYAPVFCGMLGYVMNSNTTTARNAVATAIHRRRRRLRLRLPKKLAPSSQKPQDARHAETHHSSGGREFTMHHVFLSRRP